MNEQFNSKFNALFSARTLDLIAKYLGRVLQLFAVIFFLISIVFCLVMAFSSEFLLMLALWLIVGPLVSLVWSLLLYAFGQVVNDIHEIKEHSTRQP